MKKLISILSLVLSVQSFASSILFIGDSHSAGPFGVKLHSLLSSQFDQVVSLGHSSSSSYHWVKPTDYKLSGGKFNQMYLGGVQILDPSPTDWRQKVSVPKLLDILNDNAYHDKWKQLAGQNLKADLVVIELGANDARMIANEDGQIRPRGYDIRKQAIIDMVAAVKHAGAKCIWIGPPHGINKTHARQKAVYDFLKDAIADDCPLMDSNHYKATGCDGVHFSCPSQMPKAIKWAHEAFEFIKANM